MGETTIYGFSNLPTHITKMASNYCSLLFVFLSLFVISTLYEASALGSQDKVGNWIPIPNLKDPEVVKIANFAVMENNKEAKPKTNLTFIDVYKGEKQVVAGLINYRLWISAKDGSITGVGKYLAIVSSMLNKSLKLVSFANISN